MENKIEIEIISEESEKDESPTYMIVDTETGTVVEKGIKLHNRDTKAIFQKLIEVYKSITDDKSMEKLGLTYDDYNSAELGYALDSLRFKGKAKVHSENIAKWMRNNGCIIWKSGKVWVVLLEIDVLKEKNTIDKIITDNKNSE